MAQFTYTKPVWYSSPSSVELFAKSPSAHHLELYDGDMSEHGWVPAGQATITVQLLSPSEVNNAAIAALQLAINKVQADTGVKVMKLQQMIHDLLCIENNPTQAAEEGFERVPVPDFSDADDDTPF